MISPSCHLYLTFFFLRHLNYYLVGSNILDLLFSFFLLIFIDLRFSVRSTITCGRIRVTHTTFVSSLFLFVYAWTSLLPPFRGVKRLFVIRWVVSSSCLFFIYVSIDVDRCSAVFVIFEFCYSVRTSILLLFNNVCPLGLLYSLTTECFSLPSIFHYCIKFTFLFACLWQLFFLNIGCLDKKFLVCSISVMFCWLFESIK